MQQLWFLTAQELLATLDFKTMRLGPSLLGLLQSPDMNAKESLHVFHESDNMQPS